jgi:hypothetical protein
MMTKSLQPNILLLLILAQLAATLLGCRPQSAEDYAERLPDLPSDLAATLDPATMATRIPASFPPPVKAPAPLAPCCGSTDRKTLRVTFKYTKCGRLRDFIVAPLADAILFRSGPETTQAYRLRKLNGTAFDQHICVTSKGPWNATLTEQRNCVGYTPVQNLMITAYGDPVLFVWNGSVADHPPEVGLVSCRQVDKTQFQCGGLSDCSCPSSSCPASQPCACTLPW